MLVVNTVHNKHTLQYIVRYLQGLHFSLSKLPLVKKKRKEKKAAHLALQLPLLLSEVFLIIILFVVACSILSL